MMGQTMNPHWPGYVWNGWLDQPLYNSGETKKKDNKNGVFRRASDGGRSLKRETQRREREMLKHAQKKREEKEWREQDIQRAIREAKEAEE